MTQSKASASSEKWPQLRERIAHLVASGQTDVVELLLAEHAELRSDEKLLIDCIYAEFCFREERGQTPKPEDYLLRFPAYALSLLPLLEIHAAIDQASLFADHRPSSTPSQSAADQVNVSSDVDNSMFIPVKSRSPNNSSEPHGQLIPTSASDQPEHPIRLQSPTVQVPDALPGRIGRYRVERMLGKGGFGIVYLAYDEELSRNVAIKIPHAHLILDSKTAELYRMEARTVANLDHPNIVPVLDVGSTLEFRFFVVSKFIKGSDLATILKQSRISQIHAAGLVATVADALHCAHKQGLVHRDVKPGNILIDNTGNAFVVDFGLALREGNVSERTRYAGTTAYMSPEQARGEGHRIDGRSDIYSLGVVLYELLVGRRPFQADANPDVLMQVANDEPRPPRQYDETISRELERICLKAVSKRASDRYTTAFDLAEELRHFLATVPQAGEHLPSPTIFLAGNQAFNETPIPSDTPVGSPGSDSKPTMIVPKGLRSFDAHDADFFLELLPGPRDRDGLPDSIRFWKTRIEETDADNTFSVGLIYGPSGCGKSSLVKAGLLPRLSQHVVPVYVEATAEDTEARLLNGLRKRCPSLPNNLPLKEALAALRRTQDIPLGKKVLIVLDQFEQWLHANKDKENTQLVQALRQCDGVRLQCIVMVRDDFWLSVSRFLRDLEVRIVEGQNSALVDMFPIRHAEKILTAFGRAFGVIPDFTNDVTSVQKQFLEKAIAGLMQEGKVNCVRLSLFAEMMKGKTWTLATLKDVGGTEGVGITFLEETFSLTTAPPERRYHQKAARAVLKSLLPDLGTEIKGHMRSNIELIQVSGYGSRPNDFDDLIRILDNEIRLITPTDPDGQQEISVSAGKDGEKYYQLSHDYLVPSLRDWLTRKQKETRRGRAELLLADLAAAWTARPENRQLPSFLQWLQIHLLTVKKNWSPPQRKMMAKANKYAARNAFFVLLIVGAIIALNYENYKKNEKVMRMEQSQELQESLRPKELLSRLFHIRIADVPLLAKEMRQHRDSIDPMLKELKEKSTNDPQKQLRISLAMLPVDSEQAQYLCERLLDAEVDEVVAIREAVYDREFNLIEKFDLTERMWSLLQNPEKDQGQRFRAACALARFSPDDARWRQVSGTVAEALFLQEPESVFQWAGALSGARSWLYPPLVDFLVDENRNISERRLVAIIYNQFAIGVPAAYADLEQQLTERAEPNATMERRITLDKKQASVGFALLLMGSRGREKVWPLLKHTDDPTARGFLIDRSSFLIDRSSFLVDRLNVEAFKPKMMIDQLDREKEVSIQRAILLSLGEMRSSAKSFPERKAFIENKLHRLYRDHPDSGIHGAAEGLLRKWEASNQTKKIDNELATGNIEGQRQWYLNRQGQTMVVIPPCRFLMGEGSERHECQIVRKFAIASKEVTLDEFRLFQKEHQTLEEPLPTGDCPAILVSWYDATMYCNWLSEQEGIRKDQWCYEPNEQGKSDAAMTKPLDSLQRTGYRLPTEAEWEYACRAGATTGYSCGDSEEVLENYCWIAKNSRNKIHPVGLLASNDLGLFDTHGNVWEWCQNVSEATGEEQQNQTAKDQDSRVLRGGSFCDIPTLARSAYRYNVLPTYRSNNVGFRLARTLPPVAPPLAPVPEKRELENLVK